MICVIDACAVIAILRKEPGCAEVRELLANDENVCFIHSVNLCEVYYDCLRNLGESGADRVVDELLEAGLILRDDMDLDFLKAAGRLKAGGRISLADAFAVTLATREKAVLITSDRHEFEPLIVRGNLPVTIRFIR